MKTDMELLRCYIPKRTADFIRHIAKDHNVSIGKCIEQLIDHGCIDEPDVAATLNVMSIQQSIKTQNKDEQIRTMLMVTGEIMRKIMKMNGWTFGEVAAEAEKNLDKVQNFLQQDKEDEE